MRLRQRRARVRPGPAVHESAKGGAIAWVWRTPEGPRPLIMERMDTVDGYSPDYWRQAKLTRMAEHGSWLVDLAEGVVIEWIAPTRAQANMAMASSGTIGM